jgi:hypothetical protein
MRLSGFAGKTDVKTNEGPAAAGGTAPGTPCRLRAAFMTRRIHEERRSGARPIAAEERRSRLLSPRLLQDYSTCSLGPAKQRERPTQLTAGRSH